jgi:hypothetical protein
MGWLMICKLFYSGFNIFLVLLKMRVTMKMKLRKPQRKLLHELQDNKKNTDKELLSMLEDLLVEGMVMEEMEVVEVEE